MSISLAHKLAMKLTEVRKNGMIGYLRPDGKTQVTVEYDDDLVKRIDSVIISSQHSEDVAQEQIKKDLVKSVKRGRSSAIRRRMAEERGASRPSPGGLRPRRPRRRRRAR